MAVPLDLLVMPRRRSLALCSALALAVAAGCAGDASPRQVAAENCPLTAARASHGAVLAGSGAMIAPLRLIVSAYRASVRGELEGLSAGQRRHLVPWLAPSIGTSGAVRALGDRAIDIGLAARALSPKERAGIEVYPLAQVPLAFVAHRGSASPPPDLPSKVVQSKDMKDGRRLARRIYSGDLIRWGDGAAVVPLGRQAGDATERALTVGDPALASALSAARRNGRARSTFTDQQMREALLSIEGAFGYLDLGTLRLERLPLRVFPTPAASGARRPALRLSFLLRRDASLALRRFVAFARSPQIAARLAAAGYRPTAGKAGR